MKTSWLIGLAVLFITMSVISGIMELKYLGASEVSRLQAVMSPPSYTWTGVITGQAFTTTFDYILNLWGMFWFDYAFFEGAWGIVRYILFIPISLSVIFSMVMAAVRGVSSG